VRSAERAEPVSDAEAAALFSDLAEIPALVIAVSGGSDSVALLVLLARWRASLDSGPKLTAVTVDHGLRPESRREAAAMKTLAASLGVAHRTLRWRGDKPKTGVQEAARDARYRLLREAARKNGARHVATAHTLDDQAETVLLRLARGSGLSGLSAMARLSTLPASGETVITLVRPLLRIPKSRLIATLQAAAIPFAEDPSNRDPRFTRPRLRQMAPALAAEGLDTGTLAQFAARARRANEAIAWMAEDIVAGLPPGWRSDTQTRFPLDQFLNWPAEVALRLLRDAITRHGDEGPVELAKLEALFEALTAAARTGQGARFRRTLAGAAVGLSPNYVMVERAPARRTSAAAGGKGRPAGTGRLRDTR
jgi:tRNA(Ile)-lysidine synthase